MKTSLNPLMYSDDVKIKLPVDLTPPTVTSITRLVHIDGQAATYRIFDVLVSGWYYFRVAGGYGSAGYNGGGGKGGVCDGIAYLYAGTKVLIWSGQSGNRNRNWRSTGFPVPEGSGSVGAGNGQSGRFGGGGATPNTYGESGGGGGSATGHGGTHHSDGGYGGAGAGIIAAINQFVPGAESVSIGTVFNYKTVILMALGAGGGGGCGDNNTIRSGAPGGGAWGNGGNSNTTGGTGPGGASFGRGEDRYSNYSGGARGAWCIRDFSQNIFISGLGNGGNRYSVNSQIGVNWGDAALAWINDQGTYSPPITKTIDLGSVGGGLSSSLDYGSVNDPVSEILDCNILQFPI